MRRALLLGLLVFIGCDRAAPPPPPPAISDTPVRYARDVRPLLSDRCFECHGPDAAKRQAKLRLDVPGGADGAEILRRVNTHDPDDRMPPPDSNKRPLTDADRDVLRRWIAQGAPYEPHWAFVPPARSPDHDDIDGFVLARLQREGVTPAPPADRDTQLRRLFLDMTGLPPTPDELDAPVAYEAWVERLFTEEPYRSRVAERLAAPWLDLARYADTCGWHTDAGRQIWAWRDWVLRAFRDNMPFDRFLAEQLAGDLLPGATQDQIVATGFNRNHVTTDEGGAIPEEFLVEYAVDRATTAAAAFLGLTFGCARCHEHKFDPISQEEFYRFYAFFNSIEEPGLYSQLPDPNRAFEPFIKAPSAEQSREIAEIEAALAKARAEMDAPSPEADAQRATFVADVSAHVRWERPAVAEATGAATLTVQGDGSVLATGENPAQDVHTIVLETPATGLRLLMLEAIPDERLPLGRIGRAPNGNAVLTGVEIEAGGAPVPLMWAWADHEQGDGDFGVVNALDAADPRGWAVDAHRRPGGRTLLLLSSEPFAGPRIVVKLHYRSVYDQHTLGRVRLSVGTISETAIARLPAAASAWYLVGPFPSDAGYAARFGPEDGIDFAKNYGFGNQFWRHDPALADGRLNSLADGVNVTYVGRRVFSPTPRAVEVSLGSDDGFHLLLDGRELVQKKVDRGLAADQDRAKIELPAGISTLVMKIVNTGGAAGFYHRPLPRADELAGALVMALLPAQDERFDQAWKTAFSPIYAERRAAVAALEAKLAEADAAIPRTMVMRELPQPRETFVLTRGQYDRPDKSRPVGRGIPASLGSLPGDAPQNRLGLAQWLVSAENPLTARVTVNRYWEMLFGVGLVATSDDFGLRGDWPSHPELLDWLAVEFRRDWDVRRLLTLIVTSATYRRSSRAIEGVDPRLLAWFPRRRLTAEQLRDQALFVSGLLVERFGGPSVKPYQPDGLWEEVAMTQSNTRNFKRDAGESLWRRSIYTYWKRASPPPSMTTFDAPSREFCALKRPTTNTPLQALVLWNDPQFVEAARALAQRTLDEGGGLATMYRRCTGRAPDDLAAIEATLAVFRERFRAAPEDARKLLAIGEAPRPALYDETELAAWTMVAGAFLSLDATLCRP